jgi:hypothetical protein
VSDGSLEPLEGNAMDFHTYTITRDAARKGGRIEDQRRVAAEHGFAEKDVCSPVGFDSPVEASNWFPTDMPDRAVTWPSGAQTAVQSTT